MSEITKIMFEDYPEDKREQMLRDNCYKCEESEVKIPLNELEMSRAETEIINSSDKIDRLYTELAEKEAYFKAEKKRIQKLLIDPQSLLTEALQQKRTSVKEVEEDVFYFDDQASNLMLCYDKRGVFISSRPLTPKEKQTSIFSIKNGTNN